MCEINKITTDKAQMHDDAIIIAKFTCHMERDYVSRQRNIAMETDKKIVCWKIYRRAFETLGEQSLDQLWMRKATKPHLLEID